MSIFAPRRATLVAGLFAAIPLSALAQDAAPQQPVQSQSSGLDIVLTPGRGPQAIARSGSAITVIRGEEIENAGIKSTADIFRNVPGAFVVEDGGPGQPSRLRLRGSEVAHTLVLVDGVRVNDPSNTDGHFDFANLIPADIERIEVLRGPQSALYGSDAIGGVVNIITRKGRGGYRGFAEVEGGSYGTLLGRTGISGGTKDFDYALSISGARTEGFSSYGYRIPRITRYLAAPLDKDGANRWGGMAKFAWRPFEGAEIEVGGNHTNARTEFDNNWGDAPNIGWAKTSMAYVKGTYDAWDGRLRNMLHLYGNVTDRDYDYDGYQIGYIGRRMGVSYQGDLKLDAYGKLSFGGQIEKEYYKSADAFSAPVTAERVTRSLFALHQLPIGERFDLSLGGRIDDVEGSSRIATWRATAAYRVPEWGTKFRASVGTGGKAPALDQLYNPFYGNPNLRAERSTGFDAGIDQSLFGGRANVSVTAFFNRYSSLIQYTYSGCAPTQLYGCYFNVGRAETKGIEAAGDAVLVDGILKARGTYTWLDAKDKLTGYRLLRRPEHSGSFSLVWTPTDQITIEPSVRLVGSRFSGRDFLTGAPAQKLASYARFDLRANYQVHKNLNLYLRAENLTNARYQEVYNYGTTGRAVYAGARATW